MALRILRDEVLHSARTPFRYNTGRVLIQIMKEIIRSRQDELTQLKLVHDFRKVTSGNPRLVRQFLNTYHLLEMPEEWNQLTVDHHVHDANTKGRKNATHLIMDAWIKGIRYITVVYYNYVEPAAARELLQAAEIMGVDVRIGLEFRTPFRDRFVCFVWAPRGFSDPEAFLSFLAERPMVALMNEGRKASLWMQRHVMDTLQLWNAKHAPALAEELEIPVPLLEPEAFLAYVGTGQTSFLHLAEYAHKTLLKHLVQRVKALQEEALTATSERQSQIAQLIRRMDMLTTEVIMETWLKPERNPELPSPDVPDNAPDTPELLRMPPHVLLDWLSCLRSGYRITLQLAELTAEDVLELLWDCQGMITHLELFNLKEWQEGHLRHLTAINDLQIAINKGSVLHLKQILRGMIRTLEASSSEKDKERCAKFRIILRNIPSLQAPYKVAPLRIRIGTDSTSHSGVRHGMGLAMPETLPHGARRQIARGKQFRPIYLPVSLSLEFRETYAEQERYSSFMRWLGPRLRRIWGFGHFGLRCTKEWRAISGITQIGEEGNVITMGGIGGELNNGLRAERTEKDPPALARLLAPQHAHFQYAQSARGIHPGTDDLPVHTGMVGAGVVRRAPVVPHHRPAQHSAGHPRRRRHVEPLPPALERLCKLDTRLRFPAIHRAVRSPAGILYPRAALGRRAGADGQRSPVPCLLHHRRGEQHLHFAAQHLSWVPQRKPSSGTSSEACSPSRFQCSTTTCWPCSCRSSDGRSPVDPRTRRGHHFQDGVGYGGGHHRRPCRLAQQSAAPVLGLRNQIAAPV